MSNLVLTIHAFARQGKCREFLLALGIDRILIKHSTSENPKIRANSARALKNLNSDVNEAIEEGAVSTLIAMSLEVGNVLLYAENIADKVLNVLAFFLFSFVAGPNQKPS